MRRSGRTLVASDWHLGHFSPRGAERLAFAFLSRARDAGDDVILNGDIFEGLFEPVTDAEAAHPKVCTLIAELTAERRLQRTEGNHDPGTGPASIFLEHPKLGRVLVMHGHALDPVQGTPLNRVGDAISRRFGRLAVVRHAAQLMEAAPAFVAAARIDSMFRARCLRAVEQARCALGIFGHVHRQHLTPNDQYANAGRLRSTVLEYLALSPGGVDAVSLSLVDLAATQEPPPEVAAR